MLPSFASEVKMMTEKIYEKNAYCREFTATVISCEKNGDLYDVVLDKTAFFPEGGGQRADEGTIDGIKVSDVQIENEIIMSARFVISSAMSGNLEYLHNSTTASNTAKRIAKMTQALLKLSVPCTSVLNMAKTENATNAPKSSLEKNTA